MLSTALRPSPITPSVDFDAKGVQHGHLRLPYSRDDSAWGSVMIPICVIANGEGPTALLTGANHGDEYEGPAALFELAHKLDPEEVSGRIIIVPALNYPAFRAGTRTSPIDRGNLNRSFPGRPDGTVTEKIADYVTRHLIPLADIVLDFHSGGRTLDFLPYAAAHELSDKTQEARCFEAVAAFAAPYSMKMLEIDAVGMLDTTVEELGKVFVTTELGGAGTASAKSIDIARKGIVNLLCHAGILAGAPVATPSRWLDMPSSDCFTFAEDDGLVAFVRDLGDAVMAGETVALVYPIGKTGLAPVDYRASINGVLAARHVPGLIKAGDCLSVIATVTENT
ncbi:N(2)-acetyl-L-2,4-diaminobutanoate deacetylase DoeB [Agrobacterium radiobacter]|jgi:N-alpha-acetyl-L-2,4-diaminobutyrate deacetylase|uniref:Ectoine utilization protein EutE n=1 Tax=Agrobacterium tumefaciens str. B6 TaxID=1183423 RepID=A0A822V803_AGRTU|nr:N(2)-acetyl-L-2,4-diaminobutanoate deacetylase DoeB [Agrobacterium tumefaciens]AYM08783.1 N-alpha-acetyl-L-2,4-diaminobutyrate deacetylase [Agrobacterium tumefaciens]KWT81761.1 N-alpha-acetyl diaminobutyric acid deacetylase DoeB [Agrobacterium tumefaciens str. B6]MQB26515.1 N-alpha-acetyl diaminobutyric acid deacetylase DoeB [Agrobacterium tumefaciens]NSZ35487.1 N-alpha-acetyl diaminobutyric acid deacetylase DoeB [Agrobacterium tumefaciens]NTA08170.1 N-alpha-acetyl diaminobutyric acid deace